MRKGNAEKRTITLLEKILTDFSLSIKSCNSPSILERLNTVLGGIGKSAKQGDLHQNISAGTFTRHQVPSLFEHFGAESTQGVLLLCAENSASEQCAYTLWFQNGALIHAEGQDSLGRATVKACCECQTGWYLYTEVSIPKDMPASLPGGRGVTFLLLDILREIDEERHDSRPSPPPDQPPVTEVPAVQLESALFVQFVRLVEAVREGLLMQHRAELDAWYYRQGTEQTQRYIEAERRALGRLYQWMAANGLMTIVNELQELPSTEARCERLTELLDHLSAGLSTSKSSECQSSESDIDWSILEEDGGAL